MTELLVGTKKGLVVLRGPRGGDMEIATRSFPGEVVEYAIRDPRSGRYFASVTHGQFGPHLFYTDDPTGQWQQAEGPAFPSGAGAAVERIWVVEPGVADGELWCGVAPAALFHSKDGGKSWSLVQSLWDVPERAKWYPGAGGLCLHSICPWPGDPRRLAIGISAGGVWLTEDGGKRWRRSVSGLVPRYLPEEARQDTHMHCVHNMKRAPREPATLYLQFHGGVYRSDNAGESWTDIGTGRGLPSDFGFPLAIDPHDPNRAFVIPLVADADRVTPGGQGPRVRDARPRRQLASAREGPAAVAGLPHRAATGLLQRCRQAARPLFRGAVGRGVRIGGRRPELVDARGAPAAGHLGARGLVAIERRRLAARS